VSTRVRSFSASIAAAERFANLDVSQLPRGYVHPSTVTIAARKVVVWPRIRPVALLSSTGFPRPAFLDRAS